VTGQETTFTQTTSRNQRLQTKTPEKEHVNMASQSCQYGQPVNMASQQARNLGGRRGSKHPLTILSPPPW